MKITLDIKDGLAANVQDLNQKKIPLQDGMLLKIESPGQVVFNIIEQEPPVQEQTETEPRIIPMHAGGKSGASGSLSLE